MQPGNPIVGGTVLRRPAIQSPNYVAGSEGWTINQDGSSELNSAIIRGDLQIGPSSPSPRGEWTSNIPTALVNASADFTWNSVRLFWFDATQFYFEVIGIWIPGPNVPTYATGTYLTAQGVMFDSFIQTNANEVLYGSTTYNPALISWIFRNGSVTFNSDVVVLTNGPLTAHGNFTITGGTVDLNLARPAVINGSGSGSDSTTSASYVSMTGTGWTTSISYTKKSANSALVADMRWNWISSTAASLAAGGVLVNGTDYDVTAPTNPGSGLIQLSTGVSQPITGLAAGTYTVQCRWKRTAGTGTPTRTANQFLFLMVTEIL